MGSKLSRFYDKPSTRDKLERIEQQLQTIEERKWDKIKREKFVSQILSFLPLTVLIANVCIFIYPSESTWRDKLVVTVPIAIINLILWLCRRMVQWYSQWSLDNEETLFRKLQKQKKKILEHVCETESYKVATELLEKYDPNQLRRREKTPMERPNSPLNTTLSKINASPIRALQHQQPRQQLNMLNQTLLDSSVLNQSLSAFNQPTPAPPPPTPVTKPIPVIQPRLIDSTVKKAPPNQTIAASSVQGKPVRPILNKDRSLLEKVVDWVVADGPDNRFALICRFCYGHNGMALAEDFETINFRCCYCYNLNTAINKRQVHDQLQPEREKAEQKSSAPKKDEADNLKEKAEDSNDKTDKLNEIVEGSEHASKSNENNADSAIM